MFCERQTVGARVKVLENCLRFSKNGSNACPPLICWVNVMPRLQTSDMLSKLELGRMHQLVTFSIDQWLCLWVCRCWYVYVLKLLFFLMQPTLSKWVSSMLDHLTFSTRRVMKREKKTETHLGNCGHSAPWNLLPGLEQWSHPHSRRRTSHPPSQMYLHLWTWNLGRGSNHCCYRPYMLLLVTIANNTHSIQGMVWL